MIPVVRKALIGWWVQGRWCPTKAIRDREVRCVNQEHVPVPLIDLQAMHTALANAEPFVIHAEGQLLAAVVEAKMAARIALARADRA